MTADHGPEGHQALDGEDVVEVRLLGTWSVVSGPSEVGSYSYHQQFLSDHQ